MLVSSFEEWSRLARDGCRLRGLDGLGSIDEGDEVDMGGPLVTEIDATR